MSQFAGMEDIVREFLVESHESLDRLDQAFLALEEKPGDREVLAGIFRAVHTIKGTSGFLGLARLERLAHAGESLLSLLRDGKRVLDPHVTTALLGLVDALRAMLHAVEAGQGDGDEEHSALIAILAGLAEGPAATPAPSPPMGQLLVSKGLAAAESVAEALQRQAEGDPRHIGEILVEQGAVQPAQVKEALQDTRGQGDHNGGVAESTLRVEVANLDRLMNLAGELVLVRNQLLQFAARLGDAALAPILQRLNLITTELQEGVMKTRMQPIGNVWNKFPRIVRDLALACGKQARLELEGRETELDKTILEAIKDPLTHIVRNAVDHGVEPPEARLAAGKPAEGLIRMRAWHESGQVNLEIRDDGAGLDLEAIRRKAVERGLVEAEAAAAMGEGELANLVFLPGFSTAGQVSKVSGRGVGMDVVRTNIARIGGTVDLHSARGAGSTLRIRIPLTLAIVPALIIRERGQRFAVPQVSLLELVRLEGEQARAGIEMIHGAPVHRLRGRLLPLVRLHEQLGLPAAPDGELINIVVLQADGRPFGLVVDEITDSEEIVVKPLCAALKRLRLFAGATIMGDGAVALILDVMGLARRSRVQDEGLIARATGASPAESSPVSGKDAGERASLLLVRAGDGRMAVPLELVDRLEELDSARVERAGDRELVQYRGRILPLLRPTRHLPERRGAARGRAVAGPGPLRVVVCSVDGQRWGLVVDGIEDIARETAAVRGAATRDGVAGVLVVQERVTELLDLRRLARLAGLCPGAAEAEAA